MNPARYLVCVSVLAVAVAASAQAHVLRVKIDGDVAADDAGSGPTQASAGSWLGNGETVSETAVQGLLQVIQQDSYGAALIARAEKQAEATLGQPFWKAISICPVNTDGETLGLTDRGNFLLTRDGRDVEEMVADVGADGKTDTAKAEAYYEAKIEQAHGSAPYQVFFLPDVLEIESMSEAPGICLRSTLSAADAVPVLYHEMVHYTAADWSNRPDMTKFKSESDYELQTVLSPNDEVDAYIAQWSYLIRTGKSRQVPRLVQAYFGGDGSFLAHDPRGGDNRQPIAQLILQGQIFSEGEGYHELRFMSEYAGKLTNGAQIEADLYNLLQGTEQIREENIPYYQQQSAADLAEDQRSIQRLPGEISSCEARLDSLNALVALFNSQYGGPAPASH